MTTSTAVVIAANTPGQIRGPKAKLWPFPRRVHGAVRMFRHAAGTVGKNLPIAVALNELSSRALTAWREHPKWLLVRGRANTVLAKGRLTVSNAIAARDLEVADGTALRFRYALGLRRITMPVRLLVTDAGAPFALLVVHVPTKRAATRKTRRRIVEAIEDYARACWAAGLPCVPDGDWNGADQFLRGYLDRGAKADVQAIYGIGVKFGDAGVIADAAGTVTDHRGGFPFVPITIPVSDVRELPVVPTAYR